MRIKIVKLRREYDHYEIEEARGEGPVLMSKKRRALVEFITKEYVAIQHKLARLYERQEAKK